MKALKIISKVLSGILLICVVFAAVLAVSSKLSGGTPNFFGQTMMQVLSGSMEPSIKTGSAIFVKDVNIDELQKGDVITFRSPIQEQKIITHRITEVLNLGYTKEFITQGDNNNAIDPMPIPSQNVLGKYTGVSIPYLGYITSFLQSKKGIGLALIIPGLLIIITEVFAIWRLLSRLEKKEETVA